MIVAINRVFFASRIARVFLYRLAAQNSLVFYSFFSLWFNFSPLYLKFLVFVNIEFRGVGIVAPSYYFFIEVPKYATFGSILSLPDLTKKQFLFGHHFLGLAGFDLFKLPFWTLGNFWWVGFRKNFTQFSLMLCLKGRVAEWLKAPAF
jgi:hypothetical protein